jgi:hypothetical protein
MVPETALILFVGWFIGAIAFVFLPRERSTEGTLLLAFATEAAILA